MEGVKGFSVCGGTKKKKMYPEYSAAGVRDLNFL